MTIHHDKKRYIFLTFVDIQIDLTKGIFVFGSFSITSGALSKKIPKSVIFIGERLSEWMGGLRELPDALIASEATSWI